MATIIYVLELENDKYYVGKTLSSTDIAFNQHLNNNINDWTSKFKPLSIITSFESKTMFDEDNTTKEYMIKYGMGCVRGGSYKTILLDEHQVNLLENEFIAIDNKSNNLSNENLINYIKKFTTRDELEKEIINIENEITAAKLFNIEHLKFIKYDNSLTFVVDNHSNPDRIQYRCTNDNYNSKNKNITKIEILPTLFDDKKKLEDLQILKCVENIYERTTVNKQIKYCDEDHNAKIKLLKIYIEIRKLETEHCNELSEENKVIFKENNYNNIYDIIKDNMYYKLELLCDKLSQLYIQN